VAIFTTAGETRLIIGASDSVWVSASAAGRAAVALDTAASQRAAATDIGA
jgi:hypothetical protein